MTLRFMPSPLGPRRRFDRTFYLLLLAGWLGCVGLMFMAVVYGGLGGPVETMIRPRELAMTETGPQTGTKQAAQPERKAFDQLSGRTGADQASLRPLPPQAEVQFGAQPDSRTGRSVSRTVSHTAAQIPVPQVPSSAPPAQPKVKPATLGTELARETHSLEIRAEKLFGVDKPSDQAMAQATPAAPPLPEPATARKGAAKPEPAPKTPAQPASLIQGETGVVKALRIEAAQDRFVLTITTSVPVDKHSYFYLDNPRRLALNLAGSWRAATQRMIDVPNGFVSRVVVGEHPEYLRLTLLFADRNAKGQPAPTFAPSKDGLTVSIPSPK